MRIGIDMDGVLCCFTSRAIENIKKQWGIEISDEDIKNPQIGKIVWGRLTDKQKEPFEKERDLYKVICPEGFFDSLDAYPGAIEAVNELYIHGHNIVFITKPLEWKHSSFEKINWLKRNFSNIKYEVLMTSSMEVKGLIDVDVMIDDDPRVIKSLGGTLPVIVKRPWNESFRDLEPYHFEVNGIQEVPHMIPEFQDMLLLVR